MEKERVILSGSSILYLFVHWYKKLAQIFLAKEPGWIAQSIELRTLGQEVMVLYNHYVI